MHMCRLESMHRTCPHVVRYMRACYTHMTQSPTGHPIIRKDNVQVTYCNLVFPPSSSNSDGEMALMAAASISSVTWQEPSQTSL